MCQCCYKDNPLDLFFASILVSTTYYLYSFFQTTITIMLVMYSNNIFKLMFNDSVKVRIVISVMFSKLGSISNAAYIKKRRSLVGSCRGWSRERKARPRKNSWCLCYEKRVSSMVFSGQIRIKHYNEANVWLKIFEVSFCVHS